MGAGRRKGKERERRRGREGRERRGEREGREREKRGRGEGRERERGGKGEGEERERSRRRIANQEGIFGFAQRGLCGPSRGPPST